MGTSPQKPLLVVSGVVIWRDGRYLLVQDSKPWVYGKWNLPAGRVDNAETPEQTAVREAREECGFDVEITGRLLTLHRSVAQMESPGKDKFSGAELYAYSVKIVGGELRFPKDEILDARWFTYEEIKAMQAKNEVRAPEYVVGAIELARTDRSVTIGL